MSQLNVFGESQLIVWLLQLFLSSQGEQDLEEMELLRHEAAVFAALRHPNVALFLGACFEPPNCFLVTIHC